MKKILVPGGAGFIGSHTVAALEAAGYQVVVLDTLKNGHLDLFQSSHEPDALATSACLAAEFIEGDIRDRALLDQIFTDHAIDAVIHFAAFIEAGESMVNPLSFYGNNSKGSLILLEAMKQANVGRIVFSSTAAVYGQLDPEADLENSALVETMPKAPINPYGQSKWLVECMLRDCAAAHNLQAIALRYFNAAGSDPKGRFGERHEPETHLIPLVLQAALGKRDAIKIYGTDYPTPDGTCIRDYIHVSDLADAHVKALEHLFSRPTATKAGDPFGDGGDGGDGAACGYYEAFNLGTGQGFSVRDVIETARRVTGVDFTVIEEGRRAGDPAVLVANADKAKTTFHWQPRYPNLEQMTAHAWAYLKER